MKLSFSRRAGLLLLALILALATPGLHAQRGVLSATRNTSGSSYEAPRTQGGQTSDSGQPTKILGATAAATNPTAAAKTKPVDSTITTAFSASANNAKIQCTEATQGLIRMYQTVPGEVTLGDEFTSELRVSAVGCAGDVVVHGTIPAGATLLRCEPSVLPTDGKLTWPLGDLDAGEGRIIKVTFKAEKEGALFTCATVSAKPRVCARVLVGKPVLSLEQRAPETTLIGADLTYNLVVKNIGSAAAKDVVVSGPVSVGLSHDSGKSELTYEVGALAPGQSKPLAVTFKTTQRGKVCNSATASSSNADKVRAEACTVVQVPGLKIEANGLKDQILGRNADYEIVVSNTGDTILSSVLVSDLAPAETTIVAAPGAKIEGNKATWTIVTLAPGAKATQTIKLTSKVAGTHCNAVTGTCAGLNENAKTCTLWKGIPAVAMEVGDDPDPIQVGESTTYTIKVINQGFAEIHNVKVGAKFGEQVTPVSSTQGTVSGQTTTFPVVAALGPKQSVTYTITVKGTSVGDSRNQITLDADELKTSVQVSESTTVY